MAVDASGNVYVLGAGSNNVFQIGPRGAVREIFDPFDEGLAGAVGGLHAIAVDSAGAVYVTASGTHNALRVFPKPVVEIIRSSGDGMGSTLSVPTGITTDADSRDVYVAGSGPASESVFKITPGGTVTRILDRSGDGLNPCSRPVDVAIDRENNVSVACEASNNVFKVTPAGAIEEILADGTSLGPSVVRPRLLATDAADNVYVGTISGVFRISRSGERAEIIHRESGVPIGGVTGLAVDSAANVYVSSSQGNRVYRITPSGTLHEIANGSGDGIYPLDFPNGLAIDASDTVYVVGGRSNNAFRITPNGAIAQVLDASGDHSWLHLRGVPLRRWPLLRR